MTLHRKRPKKKPKPGEKVILKALPPGFLDDLPREEQRAISAMIASPIILNKYERDGRVELEFTDKDSGTIHTLYLDPKFIKPYRVRDA